MALFDSAKHGYAGLCAASQCLVLQGLAQHQELRLLRAQSPWGPQSTWCWGRGRQVTPGLASDFQGPQSIWPQLLLNIQGLDAFTSISEAPRWTPVLTGRALGSREPRSLPRVGTSLAWQLLGRTDVLCIPHSLHPALLAPTLLGLRWSHCHHLWHLLLRFSSPW